MTIFTVTDLPDAVQAALGQMLTVVVDGLNAKASRVAPCLDAPLPAVWSASTAYSVGAQATLTGGTYLEATVGGTSSAVEPTAPSLLGRTVVDGTVTWARITSTADKLTEARFVLVAAVKRMADAGSGMVQQQSAGPFMQTVDTRQKPGYNLWPTEIKQLQAICKAEGGVRRAFSIDTAAASTVHLAWCSLYFRATYCSCGADIAGYPIFEGA